MNLTRTIKIQLAIFLAVALAAMLYVGLSYAKVPASVFGIGQYTVRLELTQTGNLYDRANVSYRGTKVGRVTNVRLTDTGVEADLALNSNISIPSNLDAEVHSATAIGEQYVALVPRDGTSAPLKNGDVITRDRTSVPPNLGALLEAANRGVLAIPNENLKTVVDEGYTAIGGLSPEFSRLVQGGTRLAIDADENRDSLTSLIDNSKPVLDSQIDTAGSIRGWAAHLATITGQLKTQDSALAGVLEKGPGAADEVRALFDRVKPTLPTLLANLVSINKVAISYQPAIEQVLVLLPQGTAVTQAVGVHKRNTKTDYRGFYLSFNTFNLNLPPTCNTGFLPASQKRGPQFEDSPPRAPGNVYCRTPQDGMWNVRGAKNYPCLEKPGKRAPTVAMCESDEQYVPLNDGNNWKGDPNATLSGQDIPQLPPGSPPAAAEPGPTPPPIAAAQYDPSTGKYVGPDGRIYTQSDLSNSAPQEKNWQSMLLPPSN